MNLQKRKQCSGRRGFTLIELLVVLPILSLLMSMLVPSLSRAMRTARGAGCLANLRSAHIGASLYMLDNHGMFHRGWTWGAGFVMRGNFFQMLQPYTLKDYIDIPRPQDQLSMDYQARSVWVCPEHQDPPIWQGGYALSYGYTGAWASPYSYAQGYGLYDAYLTDNTVIVRHQANVSTPSKIMLYGDTWTPYALLRGSPLSNRHLDNRNGFVFVDGHAVLTDHHVGLHPTLPFPLPDPDWFLVIR